MRKSNDIIILKLGGSVLTDKDKPFSVRTNVIDNVIREIIDSKKDLIIVHGGGSFGHPIAKKYKLTGGRDPKISKQVLGVAETHMAMTDLNNLLVKEFMKRNYPILSFQPSVLFFRRSQKALYHSMDVIETALDVGMTPILYGDIIFDEKGSFSIISGDEIILELCKNLKNYNVTKVIFAIEKDGILIAEDDHQVALSLVSKTTCNELNELNLASLGKKIDVTGGIRGKLEYVKEICKLGIPIQIVNGLTNNSITKALKSEEVRGTLILPEKEKRQEKIKDRKVEHLKIPLKFDVLHAYNYFEDIRLLHYSLPEVDFNDIDLSVQFFGKKISAPICIASITGGHPISGKINEILARAAEKEDIIMSVGSQRAGLVDPSILNTYEVVRKVAPNIPIIGNIGIGQVSDPEFNVDAFNKCIEMVDANVMAIHFNALHEMVQVKGDINYRNFETNFMMVRDAINIPIIAKEVGTGFNREVALDLERIGFDGFDIGGYGGTSFAAIESIRNKEHQPFTRNPGNVFREWGVPTPVSILNVRDVTEKPIIATGGLRTGIDIAKSIALGADIGGFAHKFLLSAWKDLEESTISNTLNEIKTLKNELQSSLWLMNLKNPKMLKKNRKKYIVLGPLYQWLNQ